tara:strand:+ start:1733 stop:2197 length:465 start_codon:yes stop_codon:yes gene_type:complete
MQSIFPININAAKFRELEAIDAPGAESMCVQIVDPEFASVCPRTGLPDFGTVVLQYIPRDKRVELKEWKLYLREFHGVGCFHEDCTQRIMKKVCDVLDPLWLRLTIIWGARGGLHTTTQQHYIHKDYHAREKTGYSAFYTDFQEPVAAAGWSNR